MNKNRWDGVGESSFKLDFTCSCVLRVFFKDNSLSINCIWFFFFFLTKLEAREDGLSSLKY